jgi:hypothetical protein
MSDTNLPDNEAQFMQWFNAENHRREIAHLESLRARYEWLIIVTCLLTAGWGIGLYAGYQMGMVPPDIAGITTAVVMSGGAYILWRLHRIRSGVMGKLKAERKRDGT